MSSTVEFSDVAFKAGLRRALSNIKDGSARAVHRTGERAVSEIKRRAPVRTGRLQASYLSIPGIDGLGAYAHIQSGVNYATYVEFGTSRARSQPHFRPGLLAAIQYWAQEAASIRP